MKTRNRDISPRADSFACCQQFGNLLRDGFHRLTRATAAVGESERSGAEPRGETLPSRAACQLPTAAFCKGHQSMKPSRQAVGFCAEASEQARSASPAAPERARL